jgi:hypothetical protein
MNSSGVESGLLAVLQVVVRYLVHMSMQWKSVRMGAAVRGFGTCRIIPRSGNKSRLGKMSVGIGESLVGDDLFLWRRILF